MKVAAVKTKMSGILNIDMSQVTAIIEKIQSGPCSQEAQQNQWR